MSVGHGDLCFENLLPRTLQGQASLRDWCSTRCLQSLTYSVFFFFFTARTKNPVIKSKSAHGDRLPPSEPCAQRRPKSDVATVRGSTRQHGTPTHPPRLLRTLLQGRCLGWCVPGNEARGAHSASRNVTPQRLSVYSRDLRSQHACLPFLPMRKETTWHNVHALRLFHPVLSSCCTCTLSVPEPHFAHGSGVSASFGDSVLIHGNMS